MGDKPTEKQNPGPEPERLKIDGPWGDAVKKALDAPPPQDDDKPPAKGKKPKKA